jgi:hypothetical protein
MRISLQPRASVFTCPSAHAGRLWSAAFLCSLAWSAPDARAQSAPALLATRSELIAAAGQAEFVAANTGDPAQRSKNAMVAAGIRQRLRDGDLQVGDRVVVTMVSDAVHRDTVVVRSDRTVELPGQIVVSVAGVLRSESRERVSSEVLKYVKAQQIEVTPLMRVGVLGAVARPGYFAFASDIPLTDAIMGAGGPSVIADVGRTTVRRQNQEFRSAGETSAAITNGLTLDQFGLSPGDVLFVGQRREFNLGLFLASAGAVASILTVFIALRRH